MQKAISKSRSSTLGYKWTRADGNSWHDPKFGPYRVGATLSVVGAEPDGPCGRGLHVGKTAASAIGYGSFPGRLFSVRGIGPVLGEDETKRRYASVKVEKELPKPSWVINAEAFIASINAIEFFKPKRQPLPEWKHYPTKAAAWTAAWAAAGLSAGDAARDAAWAAAGDAARTAARTAAGAAAWIAARTAAWTAAGAAAGAAAWAAAQDAARDADLCALIGITNDLRFPDAIKHRQHARQRWQVWQMGYGVACDVNGVLYTCSKP
jgi:hypothetical protein